MSNPYEPLDPDAMARHTAWSTYASSAELVEYGRAHATALNKVTAEVTKRGDTEQAEALVVITALILDRMRELADRKREVEQ